MRRNFGLRQSNDASNDSLSGYKSMEEEYLRFCSIYSGSRGF